MNTKFEDEALRILSEDLTYLSAECGKTVVEDEVLRRMSAILRRLLVEDHLGRAWRKVGFQRQPRILSPVLHIEGDKKQVVFAQAAGADYQGVEIRDVQMSRDSIPGYLAKQGRDKPVCRPLFLSEFLASTCIIVSGIEISRSDLISYFANTLGGIHLDRDREFRQQPSMKNKFEALDAHFRTGDTGGKECLYYEILSLTQTLAKSRDILKLLKRVKQELSQREA